jgi:acid phosphatase
MPAYDYTYQTLMHSSGTTATTWHTDILKAWSPENTNTNIPRLRFAETYSQNPRSDRFITNASYLNIQKNPSRCANIVDASQFDQDAAQGTLPNYVFYVPNIRNDAHDTGVAYADKWYSKKFSPYLNNDNFMKNTVLISTFDESGGGSRNQIYTSIVGPAVNAGTVSTSVNIYSLLALIEENWNLGNLGQGDVNAPLIPNIWH